MHMDGRINLKILLGYHINFLSIWPFMHHPWFPTRKSSKLTFVCFQLLLFSPCNVFNNWSWKQTNVSFVDFLVGNQGWCIKGQMLRKFIWYPKSIFSFIRPSMCISKRIKWIKKKSHREKIFFCIFFSIPSSSRHEKRCQMSQRICCLFQCSRNYLCHDTFGSASVVIVNINLML